MMAFAPPPPFPHAHTQHSQNETAICKYMKF